MRKQMNDIPVDFRFCKSLYYKVTFKNGTFWKTYRIEEAKERFINDGVRLYAYTKNLFPTTILIAWKS